MIDREILLLLVGGTIGALSSIGTLFAMYMIEGMRLSRQWQRQDMVEMRTKREELNAMLSNAMKQSPSDAEVTPDIDSEPQMGSKPPG